MNVIPFAQTISIKPKRPITLITKRERTILRLVAEGLTSEEIAGQLFITLETVKTHRKNLHFKFNVKNTASLIRTAFDQRILIPNLY